MDKIYLQYYVAKEAGVFSSSLRALAKANKLQFGNQKLTSRALKNMSYGDKRQLMSAFRQQAGGGNVRSALKSNNMKATSNYARNLDAYQQQASTQAYQNAYNNLQNPSKYKRAFARNRINKMPIQTAQSWMGSSYQLQPYSLTANRATMPSAFAPQLSYGQQLQNTMPPARSKRVGFSPFVRTMGNVTMGMGAGYAGSYLQNKADQNKQ